MIEMYAFYQLARSPLEALARRLVCKGLNIATHGRHQCPGRPNVTAAED